MKYVLDTNAVSALMKGDIAVLERLRRSNKEGVSIPQPVLAELSYGIERLPRSKRRDRLQQSLRSIRREIARTTWTDDVSEHFGAIKAGLEKRGERVEDFDVAIGAHALAAGAVLVTTNAGHLSRIEDLEIEDWAAKG